MALSWRSAGASSSPPQPASSPATSAAQIRWVRIMAGTVVPNASRGKRSVGRCHSGRLSSRSRQEAGMAGHNKWKQIKHKKAITDSRRASAWTKVIREITVAAKAGGGDPGGNPRLRKAIDDAKAVNMPGDNIERAIKKGTGELEGAVYEEVTYEGYGPGGTALLIEASTDNANRTVAEVRHAFSRNGGNLGASNS